MPGILRPAEEFRQFPMRTIYSFYEIRLEIVTALLMFIFLIKETKDGQVLRIVVSMFSNAYAT
jgi:hypothetical protein